MPSKKPSNVKGVKAWAIFSHKGGQLFFRSTDGQAAIYDTEEQVDHAIASQKFGTKILISIKPL